MKSQIKSLKKMTYSDNVNWIMKGPPGWPAPPVPQDIFERLKFVRITPAILSALLATPRKNQKDLSDGEKNEFNSAIEMAIHDGAYKPIADIHADMMPGHLMHSMDGPLGTLRFLSWHRVYLYKMEVLLGRYVPGIRIPYWDWATDRALLKWVYAPSGVHRGPNTKYTLPTTRDVSDIMMKTSYLEFTSSLEDKHNDVHNWVGGIMSSIMYSPQDPMFWLHHANIDRIWSLWKKTHKSERPSLASPFNVLDPWADTIRDASSMQTYFYYYI